MGSKFWIVFGVIAQSFFFSRFLLQWIVSERRGMSVIPNAFWYLSLFGSLMLLSYAVHIKDPVFILGQTTGTIVYLRNLMLIYRQNAG
jgi:lipid-A-disaccharide synthase-like uncharacterized protein